MYSLFWVLHINKALTNSILSIASCRCDNPRCHRRRQSRQVDDPLPSVRKKNDTMMIRQMTYPSIVKQVFKEKYHIHFSDARITVKSSINIMLNEHWNQGSSSRYTTLSPVTPQFVVLTTHGATIVDKAVKATTLRLQWEKKNNSKMIL